MRRPRDYRSDTGPQWPAVMSMVVVLERVTCFQGRPSTLLCLVVEQQLVLKKLRKSHAHKEGIG